MSLKKPFNYSWVIEGLLAGSGYPSHGGHYRFFLREGIKHLVTLTDFIPPLHLLPKGLKHHHIPIQEFDSPTIEQMSEFTGLVNRAKQRNEGVAVHCYWGRGRTGTMLAAYLVAINGMEPDAAINEIRQLRPFSIETEEQEDAVHNFSAHVRAWAQQDKGHVGGDINDRSALRVANDEVDRNNKEKPTSL